MDYRGTSPTTDQGVIGIFPEGTRDLIAIHLVDLSLNIDLLPGTLTFTVHNAFENNYARTERNLGPPSRFTLSLGGAF